MTAYVDDMGDEERKALLGGGQPDPTPHPGQRIARLESALLEAVIALEAAGAYVPAGGPDVWATAGKLREVIDGTGGPLVTAALRTPLRDIVAAAADRFDERPIHQASIAARAELSASTSPDNLQIQLEHGEQVIDGEAECWRTLARIDSAGLLWLTEEDWTSETTAYPGGIWQERKRMDLRSDAIPRLVAMLGGSDLTAAVHRDVYRDRCRQLSARVLELEDLHVAAARSVEALDSVAQDLTGSVAHLTETARAAAENWMSACRQRDEARAAIRTLATRIRRVGGYSTPEDQDELRAAERLVAGTTS